MKVSFTETDVIKHFRMEKALKKWMESDTADREARSGDAYELREQAYQLTIEVLPEEKHEPNTSEQQHPRTITCESCIRNAQRCKELGYQV